MIPSLNKVLLLKNISKQFFVKKKKKNGMADTKASSDVEAKTFLKLTVFGDVTY